MIFCAALVDASMSKEDFLKVLGHNPQFHGICFKGVVELAESSVAPGMMRRFVWRLRDENETSNDLTLVVMFNKTNEKKSLEEYQFVLDRRADEIATFRDDLADNIDPVSMEHGLTENGNIVYFMRDCNLEWLNNQFTRHARRAIKGV